MTVFWNFNKKCYFCQFQFGSFFFVVLKTTQQKPHRKKSIGVVVKMFKNFMTGTGKFTYIH